MSTVLLSGALANKPFNGGNAWSRLSWVTGFRRLGFDVLFVEQIHPECCVDASGQPAAFAESANAAYFRQVMEQFDLAESASLICCPGREVVGLPLPELGRRARHAAALFNFSGHLNSQDLFSVPGCRIYYDDDPGYTQFWHAAGSDARLAGHDAYFSLGANIGAAGCPIPTGGIPWRATRPPVDLDDWPVCAPTACDRFTTVASWRGAYGAAQHGDKTYGQKAHEFRKVLDLPRRTARRYEIALQIHSGDQQDLAALRQHGWLIADPNQAAGTTDAFRRYVQASGAEFSVAQGVYVETNSGWFSDRTVRYLASGRPALVQETGFSRHIPSGEGLVCFRTLDEAIEGAHRIVADYEQHCRAARRLAEAYFDSVKVIRRLLEEIGL